MCLTCLGQQKSLPLHVLLTYKSVRSVKSRLRYTEVLRKSSNNVHYWYQGIANFWYALKTKNLEIITNSRFWLCLTFTQQRRRDYSYALACRTTPREARWMPSTLPTPISFAFEPPALRSNPSFSSWQINLKIKKACCQAGFLYGRGGGIRTPGPRKGSPVFKTGAINRSTTPLFIPKPRQGPDMGCKSSFLSRFSKTPKKKFPPGIGSPLGWWTRVPPVPKAPGKIAKWKL